MEIWFEAISKKIANIDVCKRNKSLIVVTGMCIKLLRQIFKTTLIVWSVLIVKFTKQACVSSVV